MERERGEAFEGKGYGTLRYQLLVRAKSHIEQSIEQGYYCEAIAIIESAIGDRLESRLSFLVRRNVGFQTLGKLLKGLAPIETDAELTGIIGEIDGWRKRRNGAIHELVKVERGQELISWDDRMAAMRETATEGYQLLTRLSRSKFRLHMR